MKEKNTSLRKVIISGFLLLTGLLYYSRILMAAETDRNANGIPDSWESTYTGSITGMNASADIDGDGVNNLNEFLAGTDPTVSNKYFYVRNVVVTNIGNILSWSNEGARAYTIESATNLTVTNCFSVLASNWVSGVYTDVTHIASICAYYRLKAHWTGSNDVMTCLNCHNTNLGTRSSVVLDFTNISHHVQGSVSISNCLACHTTTSHGPGQNVVLHNADNTNTLYTLTGDPLITASVATNLTPFCLSCHDTNGAAGLAPFASSGDTNWPPVKDATWWYNSAHYTTNGAKNLSCYGDGTTFGCHATTHGSKKANMLAPYTVAAGANNAGEEEGFCYGCHVTGGRAQKAVSNEFALAIHHPVVNNDANRGSWTNRYVECNSCHNQHAAQLSTSSYTNIADSARNQVGGPCVRVSGFVVTYSDTNNFVASSNSMYSTTNDSTYMYQICFKCHSAKSWNFGTAPLGLSKNGTSVTNLTDLAQEFSPWNKSGHPIVTGLINYSNSLAPRAVTNTAMRPPWNVNRGTQTMDCNDCHNTDSTNTTAGVAAQGPHGSAQPFMLRTVFSNGVASIATNWPNVTLANFTNAFCANCHIKVGTYHTQGNHTGVMCYECHIVVPHGGKMSRLIGDGDGTMPTRYAYNNTIANMRMRSFTKALGTYNINSCQATGGSCTGNHDTINTENW